MKKIITVAILIICIIGIFSTLCFAEEETTTPKVPSFNSSNNFVDYNYKVVKKVDEHFSTKNSLPLYTSNTEDAEIACYVPQTYYFQPIEAAGSTFTIVLYNDTFLYAKTADITNLCEDVPNLTFEEGVSPYFQNDINVLASDSNEIIKIFKNTTLSDENIYRILKTEYQSAQLVGLTMIEGQNHPFYYIRIIEKHNNMVADYYGYIDPSQTSNPDINFATIKNHKYYVEPEPEVDPNAPTISPTNPESTPATSNLVRNILIGVICILCVGVVMIIYKPNNNNIQ